jgi:magnesium-protoporphyrin IX monomethyl ester (oxidative) cyclase
LRDGGIPTIVFFIIGFPGETEEDVRDTLCFARRLALDHGTVNLLFVATPLPGTPLEKQCHDEGLYTREPDNESLLAAIRLNQAALVQTPSFTKADLYAWAREELDVPSLRTVGPNIPMFFAATDRGVKNARVVFGLEVSERWLRDRNYWAAPPFAPARRLSPAAASRPAAG